MARIDETGELSEDIGQPLEREFDRNDPPPPKDPSHVEPDKPAGTADPKP